ncbi:MAG: NfeD family protein [Verrucomicrobiota bacterium]|jgi:membrane protein implicated in regulation of membrane protease activity
MDFLVYAVCFGVGLLFAIVSAFLGHLFGGHDAHVDVGTGGHAEAGFQDTGMPGLSPFSPTTITAFLTAFGGLGLIFTKLEATHSPWISAPLAVLGALIIAAGVVWLFGTVFHKMDSSSESHLATLAGMSATVITPIPANGVGEIAYVQAGTRYSAPARDERGAPVANGQTVKIVRIVGTQFYVAPI